MLDEYVNKIESEFKENDNLIKKCKAKIHELNLYNLEDRVGRITILSTLLYMPVFFGLFFLEIPGAIFPGATLFTSFGLGTIGNLLAEKKAKCKERFKKVSKSKNEKERIEEILKLEMEIERLQVRNEIINRVKSKHNNEINMIKKLSNSPRYALNIKKSNYTKDELINKINELEKSLKIKYELLDRLSYQSIIKDKKNSLNDKMTPLFQSMMCSFVPMVLSILPVFACIVARPLPAPSMIPLYTTFIPAILANSTLCVSYPNVSKMYPAICDTCITCAKECSVYPSAAKLSSALIGQNKSSSIIPTEELILMASIVFPVA